MLFNFSLLEYLAMLIACSIHVYIIGYIYRYTHFNLLILNRLYIGKHQYKMSYQLPNKETILEQLKNLGYANVPDEVLDEFMRDLSALYQQHPLTHPNEPNGTNSESEDYIDPDQYERYTEQPQTRQAQHQYQYQHQQQTRNQQHHYTHHDEQSLRRSQREYETSGDGEFEDGAYVPSHGIHIVSEKKQPTPQRQQHRSPQQPQQPQQQQYRSQQPPPQHYAYRHAEKENIAEYGQFPPPSQSSPKARQQQQREYSESDDSERLHHFKHQQPTGNLPPKPPPREAFYESDDYAYVPPHHNVNRHPLPTRTTHTAHASTRPPHQSRQSESESTDYYEDSEYDSPPVAYESEYATEEDYDPKYVCEDETSREFN